MFFLNYSPFSSRTYFQFSKFSVICIGSVKSESGGESDSTIHGAAQVILNNCQFFDEWSQRARGRSKSTLKILWQNLWLSEIFISKTFQSFLSLHLYCFKRKIDSFYVDHNHSTLFAQVMVIFTKQIFFISTEHCW